MKQQLARIADKLARAAADPALSDERYGHRLNPPLPLPDLLAFEQRHQVVLPEGYRRFLTELGNGGAGPSYGLLPLDTSSGDGEELAELDQPSVFQPGTHYPSGWLEQFYEDEDGDDPDPLRGTLEVVHHGCTSFTHLIVSGPGRGRLVQFDSTGGPGPYVLEDPDFLSWYERWLDELLAGYRRPHGKLPGDEAALLGILAGDPDPRRRARAVESLPALAEITPAAAAGIAAAVADADPLVREAALGVAWRSEVAGTEVAARGALADPVSAVRAEAIHVLREFKTADLAERARGLLGDEDAEVLRAAMWSLADSGELVAADVAPLLGHPEADTRGWALYSLAEARGEVTELLRLGLADVHAHVRLQAVQIAEKRGERTLLPALRDLLAREEDSTVRFNLIRVTGAWA